MSKEASHSRMHVNRAHSQVRMAGEERPQKTPQTGAEAGSSPQAKQHNLHAHAPQNNYFTDMYLSSAILYTPSLHLFDLKPP
jgi:hypothetical protein